MILSRLFLTAAFAAAASAWGAPVCISAPLSTYTAGGFVCELDGTEFSDFSFLVQTGGAGGVLDEDDITVSPLTAPGEVGLRFSGLFTATGGPDGPGPATGIRVNAYRFFFSADRASGDFTDVGVTLNDPMRFAPNPAKFGDIFASNYASNDGAQAIANDDDVVLTNFVALNSNRLSIPLDNLIQLAAGASAAGTVAPVGTASLDSADFLFRFEAADVPEPSPLGLVGGSMVLIGLYRMRRKRD